MAQITLEFDNQLQQQSIEMPLIQTSSEEIGEDKYNEIGANVNKTQQTSIYGVISPLITVNDVVLGFDDIISFSLTSEGALPALNMSFLDRFSINSRINKPKKDNQVRVVILPPFENAYKKINLTFYITNVNIRNNIITLSGIYKSPLLLSSQFKSFGEINSYNLFKQIAIDSKLGFATNIQPNDEDLRYIYCDNISYLELMNREIETSGAEGQVLDYWIDFWNNINLADIKERYTTIDKPEDLKIWVSNSRDEIEQGIKQIPYESEIILSNHPSINSTDMGVKSYMVNSNISNSFTGSDKLYSIYEFSKDEYADFFIQDGNIYNDIFKKYEYLGENYGQFNYLYAEKYRKAYLEKINSESVEITMRFPTLALMRGHKVNFVWYNNDNIYQGKERDYKQLLGEVPNTNLKVSNPNENDIEEDTFKNDKSISGQYLITAVKIEYNSTNRWSYKLNLNKPQS